VRKGEILGLCWPMEEYVIAAMLGHGKKNITRRYAQALISQMRPIIEAAEQLYRTSAEAERRE
jgi:hypothetical protein